MKIDQTNSNIEFTIVKLFFLKVKGTLPEIKGNIELNQNDMSASSVSINIPLAKLDTKNAKRNEHLQQKDFFNVSEYPEMSFTSDEISEKNNQLWANGKLTIAGTTNNIEFPFQYNEGIVSGNLSLDRTTYKIGKIPGFVASKNVDISFNCKIA
ncbi:MAG: YceI family protein [Crocinitomicaceae bacterium]